MKKYRLYDQKGEVYNYDSPDGTYTKEELENAKKNLEPNGIWIIVAVSVLAAIFIIIL